MTSCNGPISVPSDAGPMEQRRSGLNWDRFTRGSLSSKITEEGSDGMAKRVAELMVEVLSGAGVKRVYDVSGDSLNGFTVQYAHRSSFSGFTCGTKRLQPLPRAQKHT
jgi:hypothetical protein